MNIKRDLAIAFFMVLLISCGNSELKEQIAGSDVSDLIRINQVGYYPSPGKRFTVADELREPASVNPYGIPISRFEWGSNSDVLNTSVSSKHIIHYFG